MDGGQKFKINLEAGLDVNTSDMLVPLAQPTLQHNWQKYQGKCLPNSLRFEKNGWAAGWNVYNFDYEMFREEQHGKWLGAGQFNTYVKTINIYDTEDGYNPLFTVYIVPKTTVTVGDVTVTDNVIKGKIKNKPFELTWDPVAHELTCVDSNIGLEYKINSDYSVAAVVTDLTSSFSMSFDLLVASDLTSDSVSNVSYTGYADKKHTWNDYAYNLTTGKVVTPEGISVTPVVTDNQLTFDYNYKVTDEVFKVAYTLEKYYPQFTNLTWQDQATKTDMTLGANATKRLAFNKYKANVSPRVLKAYDEDGVVIDYQVPLWFVARLSVVRSNPNAKRCDNTGHYEIATISGTGLNMGGTYNNIFAGEGDFTISNGYRPSDSKYINGLPYRFNQIFLNNTIEPSAKWDYRKHVLNSNVWPYDARSYANLRSMNRTVMTRYLGDVYTWGTFTFNPEEFVSYNNPYNWADSTNIVYTSSDISGILSFKAKDAADNTDEGDDETFVKSQVTDVLKNIAQFTGTVTEYTLGQAAQTYADLYTNGRYVGNTYETVGTSTAPVWPFEKVPKFNYMDGSGNVHEGVYYTDGADTIIDSLADFKSLVLGEQDTSVDLMNECVKDNGKFDRTRVVRHYKVGYDFNWPTEYEPRQKFRNDWEKHYPDYTCPLDAFDENAASTDTTYTDFADVTVLNNQDPKMEFVAPGVYISGEWAVPFDCPSGVIIYDGGSTSLAADVWHHSVNAKSKYIVNAEQADGQLAWTDGPIIDKLPNYFGRNMQDTAVCGLNERRLVTLGKSITVSSAIITLGINYNYEYATVPTEHGTMTILTWVPKPARDDNWVKNVLVQYYGGAVHISDAKLNSDVESVGNATAGGDINEGIKFAWPLLGHSMSRLRYPEMKDMSHISDADAFILETIPTSELSNRDRIYFDRGDTDKSMHIYDIVESSKQPDSGDRTGNYCVTAEPVDEAYLYYAQRQVDANGNEILMPYYIPGIAYGDPMSTKGNMTTLTEMPILEIDWKPMIRKFPTSLTVTFSNKNTKHSIHRFYTEDFTVIDKPDFVLNPIDVDLLTQTILLKFKSGIQYTLTYDSADQSTVGESVDILDNTTETASIVAFTGKDEAIDIPLNIDLRFLNNKARFIKLSDNTLVSSDGNNCVITDGTNTVTYSVLRQDVVKPAEGVTTTVVNIPNGQRVNLESKTQTNITAYLKAVYDGEISDEVVSFEYAGETYVWDLSKISATSITVLSTDIRDNKTKSIGRLRSDSEYQLLRQQWNTTVDVENYWWLDPTHVLELNQFNLVLKRNTKELDDWNGERFEVVNTTKRDRILPATVLRHFVTSCFNTRRPAIFITVQEDLGQILLRCYNPRKNFAVQSYRYIRIRQREIGQVLNDQMVDGETVLFNTYNPLTATQVISRADWSSTIVGDYLIIGCHLGNNYDQWAFVIDLRNDSIRTVVQGYGYVGLHGDLTGGQIPDDYFDVERGFTDMVQPLSVLKNEDQQPNDLDEAYEVGSVDKINKLDARVVGTSEQQWYIQKKLHGIVSHLTFNNGEFTKQLLPITNNFAAVYKSPSWASSVLGDLLVQVTTFESMLHFDGSAGTAWTAFCALIGYPLFYVIAPRYGQIVYLQQTFGQYAYVHYNSSKSMPEKEIGNDHSEDHEKKNLQTDPVLSADFTFDKQKFTQNSSTKLDYFTSVLCVLLASFAESLQMLDKKQSVNEEQNQSAVSDFGRKFVDNAVLNTSDMLATGIITQSKNDTGCTSVVTGLKSLDMFYSTSDQQHVYAGPGFVEHQLVADCVAQSVTDTQLEGKVQQMFFCIRALTEMTIQQLVYHEKLLADGLDKKADATAAQMVCGTSMGAVAVGLHAAASALRIAVAAQEVASSALAKMLDAFCAKGITVNTDTGVTKHALSVEGKHRYGEKNEEFMWPCWGIQSNQIKYTNEWVECGVRKTTWPLTLFAVKYWENGLVNSVSNLIFEWTKPRYSSNQMGSKGEAVANVGTGLSWKFDQDGKRGDTARAYFMRGPVPFYQAAAYGKAEEQVLPDDMACIEGVCRFLPNEPFKNENIAVSEPAFAPSMQQDYIIDKSWDLSQYCTYGKQQWVAVKDTKVIDCPPSNIIVTDTFCGVSCPYTAVEVKRGIEKAYMRPWAVTPDVLAMNCTGFNSILNNKLYHSFDGVSYRIVNLVGSPGMNKNRQTFLYAFQLNDRFKRSNKVPANELQGNFESEPIMAVDSIDKLWSLMTIASKEKGLEAGTIGEDKDLIRWAIPVFTEHVSTLPAAVKTMTAMPLGVVEGVTSLCVDLANNQSAYKAPLSVDFTIGKQVFRATEEYICSVQTQNGIDIVTDLIPILGLKFIGSTPTEAYFYSKSTRCYYVFSGSNLVKIDMMERFRDIQKGYWDFVNQEVVMPCLMTFKRLNPEVRDTDSETDNIIVPVLSKGQVTGELPPPITTVFNDRSWYKCISLPCGFAYQGPNRVIINRVIFTEYMLDTLKANLGKWNKMDKENYVTKREYPENYVDVVTDVKGVDGWTHNPFIFVTSPLGLDENTDCKFEWVITFCWPVEMDLIYGIDNFAVVNIAAETMTPGGKVTSRPTHVYLTKELFTRTGNYGYYSFRYQSNSGIGNRERLHIWSDQYIAISSIDCECKSMTTRRNEQLTQQVDTQQLKEL